MLKIKTFLFFQKNSSPSEEFTFYRKKLFHYLNWFLFLDIFAYNLVDIFLVSPFLRKFLKFFFFYPRHFWCGNKIPCLISSCFEITWLFRLCTIYLKNFSFKFFYRPTSSLPNLLKSTWCQWTDKLWDLCQQRNLSKQYNQCQWGAKKYLKTT